MRKGGAAGLKDLTRWLSYPTLCSLLHGVDAKRLSFHVKLPTVSRGNSMSVSFVTTDSVLWKGGALMPLDLVDLACTVHLEL